MSVNLYTLAELSDSIYSRLESNTVMFTQLEVTSIINEALKSINLATGFYTGSMTLISNAGQLVYPTPVGMIFPMRVQFEAAQLDTVPVTRIGQDYRTWTTDTTASTGGPVARWVPIGINYFCLHPADSRGGGSIAVTGVLETPNLALSTDTMSLDDQYATLVVEYSCSRLPLKIGGNSAAAAMKLYQQSYLPVLKSLTRWQQMKWPIWYVNRGKPITEGQQHS